MQSEAIVHGAPNVPGAAASDEAPVSRPPPSPQPLHWPPELLLPALDPDVEPLPDDDELPVDPEPLLDDVSPPDPLPEPGSEPLHPAARSETTTQDDSRDTRTRVFMRVLPIEQPACERTM
jgi:hypothetical protein